MIRPRIVLFSLGIIALTAFIVAFSRIDAEAQEFIEPAILEAWGALEPPTDAEREAGLRWAERGDTWLLRLPAPRLGWFCDDPLGCIQIVGSGAPFCVMRVRSELPQFMEEAVVDVLRAQCGAVLSVAVRD